MILTALNTAGGADYLAKRAEDCPTAFLALVGRVLPMQVTGANGSAIAVDFRWADAEADAGLDVADIADMGVLSAPNARTDALTIDGERVTDEPA
jgi:hypothetical protein